MVGAIPRRERMVDKFGELGVLFWSSQEIAGVE